MKAQYWQWELEGFKNLIVIAVAGLAGAVTLGGAGLFTGNGDKLMWSIYGFTFCLLFAYLAIFCGARSFELATQPSKSGHPKPAGKLNMVIPTLIGALAVFAVMAGLWNMYFGALDGMIKQGVGGTTPPKDKVQYSVKCSTVERPASVAVAQGKAAKPAKNSGNEMTCQISS